MKRTLLAVALTLCTASLAHAQFTRTWVSGAGDDANQCTRTSPCRTFAGAMSRTLEGGEINAIDPGTYGPVTISKSITIDGGGTQASILASGTGVLINADPSDVVILRNLSINGAGGLTSPFINGIYGIRATSVGDLHVENVNIEGFLNRGISFEATDGYLHARDVTIKNIGTHAVYVGNARAMLERLTANGNGTGVIAAGAAAVSIKHSVVNGNGTGFAAAYGPTAQINIDDSVMSNNQWGIVVGQGATAYVSNSSLFNNYIRGLFNADGISFLVSYGTNRFAGNAADGSFTSGMALR